MRQASGDTSLAERTTRVTEPTAEALAWHKRAAELRADGVTVGAREICEECLRPMWQAWGFGEGRVEVCDCGAEPHYRDMRPVHGLEGVVDETAQSGTVTYG